MAGNCVLLGFLAVFAWTDVRNREFPLLLPIAGGAAGVVLWLILREPAPASLLGGVSVGGALLIGALLSKENIGVGDGLLFCVTGLFLGLWGNLVLLFLASLSCGVAGLARVAVRKGTMRQSLPLAPFVLAADVAMLALVR